MRMRMRRARRRTKRRWKRKSQMRIRIVKRDRVGRKMSTSHVRAVAADQLGGIRGAESRRQRTTTTTAL